MHSPHTFTAALPAITSTNLHTSCPSNHPSSNCTSSHANHPEKRRQLPSPVALELAPFCRRDLQSDQASLSIPHERHLFSILSDALPPKDSSTSPTHPHHAHSRSWTQLKAQT
ncbi:hypothetical protein CYLTODRAFT_199113 [Cylindrobasidium torrendii FP15055 ss-10]|uniref:Uncharacterized protein n=1 Tax=Cylindrobasidium torrendii FP15055 ss-10 TaxID=1314674 RepID=A0A0D7AVE8_9AGAR|nr:hypothetical protein CYLTODRAFT_199113 [Cylindrobasidium torrendii FP15055 ss-10]